MAAAQVLALYRQLLRVAKRWPLDERRPGRALQPFLVTETKAAFKNNRYVVDSERVAALIAEVCLLV